MHCMKLVSLESADSPVSGAPASVTEPIASAPSTILLIVGLADATQRSVFISNLTTQVADDVLTAAGTVNIPGQCRDTFIALVKAVDDSDNRIVLTVSLGSPERDPLRLVAEVSPLLEHEGGSGAATDYVSSLLNQFLSGPGP